MQIELTNIKKIKSLTFTIPRQGVWILTGLNGSGKTTLLAAIFRIRAQHAFQKHYKTSPLENRLDNYDGASVKYSIDGQEVTYKYGGKRWRARPRANSGLFERFPFPVVEYIDANAERIEPFADEINIRRLLDADIEIKLFLRNVLGDPKWDNLKYVNTRRGRGNDAYLIPYRVRNENYYYSEKSFSLGELCVFKLAKKIHSVPDGSLLLIDELEMALHPQAQVRLVDELKRVADIKILTIIFSTHSATIIKTTSRKNLMYLKEDIDRTVSVTQDTYPAQVLGEVAFDDELTADFMFFVEDKEAQILLEQIVGEYFSVYRPERSHQPLYKIAPVGGFIQVVEMLNSASYIFPSYVKRFAFLDEDVHSETLREARRSRNHQLVARLEAPGVKFLPTTPELGFITMIELPTEAAFLQTLEGLFQGNAIRLARVLRSQQYLAYNSQNLRERAKNRMEFLVNHINTTTGVDHIQIKRKLYAAFVKKFYRDAPGNLPQLLGPVFNAR